MTFLISSRPLTFVFYPETRSARGTPKPEQLNSIRPILTSLFTPALSPVKLSSRLPACSIRIHYKPVYEYIIRCGSKIKPDSDVIALWQKHLWLLSNARQVRTSERKEEAVWTVTGGKGCAAGVGDDWQCVLIAQCSYLCASACRAKIWADLFLWKQKVFCVFLIRPERGDSAPWRLAPWLRSPHPTSASPPKTTATDHFSFSVHRGVGLQCGVRLLRCI